MLMKNFDFIRSCEANKYALIIKRLSYFNCNLLSFVEIDGEEALAASEDEKIVDNIGEESSEIDSVVIAGSINLDNTSFWTKSHCLWCWSNWFGWHSLK